MKVDLQESFDIIQLRIKNGLVGLTKWEGILDFGCGFYYKQRMITRLHSRDIT